eukprot:756207-Hanusia_phi.AAC.4
MQNQHVALDQWGSEQGKTHKQGEQILIGHGQISGQPFLSNGQTHRSDTLTHDSLVTELMHEVEAKRNELENMTISVVQWKQSFKDKLQQEKKELQRDAQRAEAVHMFDKTLLQEKMSQRILRVYQHLCTAVAFQKLREHRKQSLWLQRVKELKNTNQNLKEELEIASSNSLNISTDFSQNEFVQRLISSISCLISIAEGKDNEQEGGWILADVLSVGNALVAEKLRNLLKVISKLREDEVALQQQVESLSRGHPAVAYLQVPVKPVDCSSSSDVPCAGASVRAREGATFQEADHHLPQSAAGHRAGAA